MMDILKKCFRKIQGENFESKERTFGVYDREENVNIYIKLDEQQFGSSFKVYACFALTSI